MPGAERMRPRKTHYVKLRMNYQGPVYHGLSFLITKILGILSCLDGFMNIALEQTEEYVNGAVTNR